uniref:Uncharacterized protein n=1 Tax=Chryseobacterium sp. B5 TaxID=2050562 RepID=A0A2G7T347_9FLAO
MGAGSWPRSHALRSARARSSPVGTEGHQRRRQPLRGAGQAGDALVGRQERHAGADLVAAGGHRRGDGPGLLHLAVPDHGGALILSLQDGGPRLIGGQAAGQRLQALDDHLGREPACVLGAHAGQSQLQDFLRKAGQVIGHDGGRRRG